MAHAPHDLNLDRRIPDVRRLLLAPETPHLQALVMSTAQSTPEVSPIQPLHNPAAAAKVEVPQAPLGNATNLFVPGLGEKALLAKKLATQRG